MSGLSATRDLRTKIDNSIDEIEIQNLLTRLLRVPSYRTELLEKEPMVLDFIKKVVYKELQSNGINDITIDDAGNLIARIRGVPSGPKLLYVSYAMTGAPETMKEPFSGEIIDGRRFGMSGRFVRGRGANEQKGTLASMLLALITVARLEVELAGDVILVVLPAGETGNHDALQQVIEVDDIKANHAVIAGESKIQVANKGRLDIFVNVEGQASHSRTPWDAIDAIHGMFEVYQRLHPMIPYLGSHEHRQLGKATLVPTRIESFPEDAHTIQSRCVLTLDRRLLPGEDPADAFVKIKEAVGRVEPYKISVEMGQYLYPSEVPLTATIVKNLAGSIEVMLGVKPEFEYSPAAYDAGYLNHKGVETVRYGAGNTYFPAKFGHSDMDVVSVQEAMNTCKVFTALALRGEKSKS
jgi:acetylornithine deacetylase